MRRMRNPNELFVGDLSFFCREHHLMDLFSSCGGVVDARIKRSETKGKTLMYGFVRMDSLKGALTAAKELNGFIFMGRAMKVQLSLTNTYHDHTQVALQGFQVHSSFTSYFPIDAIIEPDEGKLRRLYEPYGEIYDVVVKEYIVHHKEQRQEGYGFITFATEEQAHLAASQCSCVMIDGIRIESMISHRSRTHDPAIPGYPLNQNIYPPSVIQPMQSIGDTPRIPPHESPSSFYQYEIDLRGQTHVKSSDNHSYTAFTTTNQHPNHSIHSSSYMSHHQSQQALMQSTIGMTVMGNNGGMNAIHTPSSTNQYHYQQQQQLQQPNNQFQNVQTRQLPQHPALVSAHLPVPPPPPPSHDSLMAMPSPRNPPTLSVQPPQTGPTQPLGLFPGQQTTSQQPPPPPNSSPMFFPSTLPLNLYPVAPPPPSFSTAGVASHNHHHQSQHHMTSTTSSSDISMDRRLYMPPNSTGAAQAQQAFSSDQPNNRNSNSSMFLQGDNWNQPTYQTSYNFQPNALPPGFHSSP